MKIPYSHFLKSFNTKVDINELSKRLFQLGHEHEVEDEIFNFEFTPNRGDCLSLDGILRDLNVFYEINLKRDSFDGEIPLLKFNFENRSPNSCPNISFLKIEIDNEISEYTDNLKDYFNDLNVNKNNFFTDISNFISYETGQPTHCYDSSKLSSEIVFTDQELGNNVEFETLLDTKIILSGNNSVFMQGKEIINLAGVVGNNTTRCTKKTRSVIIECAYFNPESIIGKSIKYDVKSDAAHKFERGVDNGCHDKILRRFIYLVQEHAKIKSLGIFTKSYKKTKEKNIKYNLGNIAKIIGIELSDKQFSHIMTKLGFKLESQYIGIPSYRHDISNLNDIAEEIARVVGYDSIPRKDFSIPTSDKVSSLNNLHIIKNFLIQNGFYEVINFPFASESSKKAITIDNPIDMNKSNLRLDLKNSLTQNLLYNERRQQDSIKLFEVSEINSNDKNLNRKNKIALIASGRVGKNYRDFSKKIDKKYLSNILKPFTIDNKLINISREKLNSKSNNDIFYLEVDIHEIKVSEIPSSYKNKLSANYINYEPISEYPMSIRDISFSITDIYHAHELQKKVLSYDDVLLKERYIFDYFHNKKNNELKIGFRFVFQSKHSTLKDVQVDNVINEIINTAFEIKSVSVPGLNL